jgi:mutator protein MutT
LRIRTKVQALPRRSAASERLNPTLKPSAIHVVAAAVIDGTGRVLIAQRLPGKHFAGGWEFPGGKLEPGEDRRVGLARELREELGITITTPRPLIRVRHTYDYGEVLIDMWVVRHYSGEPIGLDGQALRWCAQDELTEVELLPADGPIVTALRLPERLTQVSTSFYTVGKLGGRDGADGRDGPDDPDSADFGGRLRGVFCAGMASALAGSDAGADFLVLQNELAHGEIKSICELVPVPVYVRGVRLKEAWGLGATGVDEIGG